MITLLLVLDGNVLAGKLLEARSDSIGDLLSSAVALNVKSRISTTVRTTETRDATHEAFCPCPLFLRAASIPLSRASC